MATTGNPGMPAAEWLGLGARVVVQIFCVCCVGHQILPISFKLKMLSETEQAAKGERWRFASEATLI